MRRITRIREEVVSERNEAGSGMTEATADVKTGMRVVEAVGGVIEKKVMENARTVVEGFVRRAMETARTVVEMLVKRVAEAVKTVAGVSEKIVVGTARTAAGVIVKKTARTVVGLSGKKAAEVLLFPFRRRKEYDN